MKRVKLGSYKDLIRTVAISDFKLKYKGSILGYLWSLAKPLFLFIVLFFVFTRVFRIGGTVPNFPVYLLLGIVFWSFFSESTVTCLFSIVNKGDLIRKVYFPRVILVISDSLTAFLTFLASSIIVLAFMLYFKIIPGLDAFLIVPLFFEIYFLSLGVGLLLGALFVKFRDISHIWEVFLQAMFYATPILYPLSLVPDALAKIMVINPVAQIVQDARYILITKETETAYQVLGWPLVLVPYLLVILIFFIGLSVFNKVAVRFAEEI